MINRKNGIGYKLIFCFFFLLGIIFITILSGGKTPENTLMNQALSLNFLEYGWNKRELFLQCLWSRGIIIIVLFLLLNTSLRKWVFRIMVLWIGFVFGMLIKLFFVWYGIKGIGLLILAALPHYIFYWMACGLFYWEMEKSRISMRRNKVNIYLAIGVVIMGMFLESYVNPFLVSGYIKLFF